MIIDYIRLNNFLSHNDTDMRFENGVNIIYGKNGAGKSSIVDAIRFALFGEKRGDRIAELIRSNTGECSVTIGFRLNDMYYEVFRSLGLGKSGNITKRDSWMKLDGNMIAETSEGVTKEIQNGLRIPKDIFLNSVFVRQGEMDALISETQANREKLFSKIIGIEALSESAQKIKAIRDSLKLQEARFTSVSERVDNNRDEIDQAENGMKAAKESLEEETGREAAALEAVELADRARNEALQKKTALDSVTARLRELELRITQVKRNIENNRERISGISYSREQKEAIENDPLFSNRVQVARYLTLRSEARTLEVSLDNTRTAIDDYNKEKEKLDSLLEGHLKYREVEEQLTPMEEKIRGMQSSRALRKSLEEEIASDRTKENNLLKVLSTPDLEWLSGMDRKSLADSMNEMEKRLRTIEGERNALKERLGSLNRQLADLRKNKEMLGDRHKCPVCGSELDETHLDEIHSKYQSEENDLMQNVGETGGRISALNTDYRTAEDQLRKLRGPDVEKYIATREEHSRMVESIASREKRLSEIMESAGDLEQLEEKYNSLKEAKEGLQSMEKEYNSVSYAIGKVPIDDLKEKLAKHGKEEEEKKALLKDIADSIGFEPDEKDRTRLDDLAARYDRIRDAEAEHQKILNELERDSNSRDELEAEFADKEEQRKSMGDVLSELEKSNEEYSLKQSTLSGIRQSVAALKERIRTFNDTLERLAREKASLEKDAVKLERIRGATARLEKLRGAFERNGIQALIRKDSSVAINNMTRNYLSSFNFEFDDVRIDENFDIKVINNSVEEPLDSLSGGERISLAIAVRLAIARYLTGRVSTVIMDEPTNFLDEDRRNNLKDIIQYSLKDENMVQQMIMITHHSELTSAADSSFEVTKANGVSKVLPG